MHSEGFSNVILLVAAIGLLVVGLFFTSSCVSYDPCADNPRNMSCMSPDQLRKELAK
jgi:hypothetical protein